MKKKCNIGLISFYKDFSKIKGDGLRENGNIRFVELWNLLEKNNFNIEIFNHKKFNSYDIILFKDIPRINELIEVLIKKILNKNIPLILWLDETPIARNRSLTKIPFLFKEVWVNTINNFYNCEFYKTFNYKSASLPSREEIKLDKNSILKGNRKNKICYIGANKSALNKKSSYSYRSKLVKIFKKEYYEFKLYGRGWNKKSIPMDLPGIAILNKLKPLKKLILKLINLKYQYPISEGVIKSKYDVMLDFDFCLGFEPYLGKPYMVLDKIFDPMLAGCIPIYLGPETDIGVPSNCYIKINKKIEVNSFIKEIINMGENEKKIYRENIYNYLISDKANDYRYNTFAYKILKRLLLYKS